MTNMNSTDISIPWDDPFWLDEEESEKPMKTELKKTENAVSRNESENNVKSPPLHVIEERVEESNNISAIIDEGLKSIRENPSKIDEPFVDGYHNDQARPYQSNNQSDHYPQQNSTNRPNRNNYRNNNIKQNNNGYRPSNQGPRQNYHDSHHENHNSEFSNGYNNNNRNFRNRNEVPRSSEHGNYRNQSSNNEERYPRHAPTNSFGGNSELKFVEIRKNISGLKLETKPEPENKSENLTRERFENPQKPAANEKDIEKTNLNGKKSDNETNLISEREAKRSETENAEGMENEEDDIEIKNDASKRPTKQIYNVDMVKGRWSNLFRSSEEEFSNVPERQLPKQTNSNDRNKRKPNKENEQVSDRSKDGNFENRINTDNDQVMDEKKRMPNRSPKHGVKSNGNHLRPRRNDIEMHGHPETYNRNQEAFDTNKSVVEEHNRYFPEQSDKRSNFDSKRPQNENNRRHQNEKFNRVDQYEDYKRLHSDSSKVFDERPQNDIIRKNQYENHGKPGNGLGKVPSERQNNDKMNNDMKKNQYENHDNADNERFNDSRRPQNDNTNSDVRKNQYENHDNVRRQQNDNFINDQKRNQKSRDNGSFRNNKNEMENKQKFDSKGFQSDRTNPQAANDSKRYPDETNSLRRSPHEQTNVPTNEHARNNQHRRENVGNNDPRANKNWRNNNRNMDARANPDERFNKIHNDGKGLRDGNECIQESTTENNAKVNPSPENRIPDLNDININNDYLRFREGRFRTDSKESQNDLHNSRTDWKRSSFNNNQGQRFPRGNGNRQPDDRYNTDNNDTRKLMARKESENSNDRNGATFESVNTTTKDVSDGHPKDHGNWEHNNSFRGNYRNNRNRQNRNVFGENEKRESQPERNANNDIYRESERHMKNENHQDPERPLKNDNHRERERRPANNNNHRERELERPMKNDNHRDIEPERHMKNENHRQPERPSNNHRQPERPSNNHREPERPSKNDNRKAQNANPTKTYSFMSDTKFVNEKYDNPKN